MKLDEIDKKVLNENFDEETINKIDNENVLKIMTYLLKEGVYYAKDIFLESLDLFLLDYSEFILKFENLKTQVGPDYIEKLGSDTSIIEIMYL